MFIVCSLRGEVFCFQPWPANGIVVVILAAKNGLRLGDELCTLAVER